jgi:hypothetical protein
MAQQTVTKPVTGTASGVYVEIADGKRRYLGLYAQSGGCLVSFGPVADHAANAITIAEGNLYEVTEPGNGVNFSGDGSVLLILSNIDAKHLLMSDNVGLTSDGYDLWYAQDISKSRQLIPPVFN